MTAHADAVRALAHLDEVHSHEYTEWTERIATPGFSATHAGISTWCCADCAPIVKAIITRHFGAFDSYDAATSSISSEHQTAPHEHATVTTGGSVGTSQDGTP